MGSPNHHDHDLQTSCRTEFLYGAKCGASIVVKVTVYQNQRSEASGIVANQVCVQQAESSHDWEQVGEVAKTQSCRSSKTESLESHNRRVQFNDMDQANSV